MCVSDADIINCDLARRERWYDRKIDGRGHPTAASATVLPPGCIAAESALEGTDGRSNTTTCSPEVNIAKMRAAIPLNRRRAAPVKIDESTTPAWSQ